MKQKHIITFGIFVLMGTMQASSAPASGDTVWMTIGDPGNEAQSFINRYHGRHEGDGFGAVGYTYQIGKYAVTIADWQRFLNDPNANSKGPFHQNFAHWNDGIRSVGQLAPVVSVSLHQAAQYANWLSTGDATKGTYSINEEGMIESVNRDFRNASGEAFVIPTENEWFKAAYFDSETGMYSLFAHGEDEAPTITSDGVTGWNYGHTEGAPFFTVWDVNKGTPEQNGTVSMMGNVWEWVEDLEGVVRGGRYRSHDNGNDLRSSNKGTVSTSSTNNTWGFRLVRLSD
jgi:formylglycine-generating enzyme